ncbi:hypothetical protein [Desulfocurvibacter africanus]|uniref:Uncharacterized protein n=1 Tax=Desulfocurvibacter africanus subsp. africanus str. Walvis Bay TaxID=690850 RepID=F3YZX6_DESAF|nr:hypothetical protein [Desulfocurvibacter africanus]EGJ50931.1 hypothetical protein Desaf_2612 [Desulfocurvibacter africanus subsp. africanus str. Walvis Bay]
MVTRRIGNAYDSLDEETRRWMLVELDEDEQGGVLYYPPLLTDRGREEYRWLLREALKHHDDAWLAHGLDKPGLLRIELADSETMGMSQRGRRGPRWRTRIEQPNAEAMGTSPAEVPMSVIDDMAADEFNRYYSRGVCRRVLESGLGQVEIYKIEAGANLHLSYPVPGSENADHAREVEAGRDIDADYLLGKLRRNPEEETGEALPGAPGSGLSVRLPA